MDRESAFRCVRRIVGGSAGWEDGAYGFRGGWNMNWIVSKAVLVL